jgi:general stress protein 26
MLVTRGRDRVQHARPMAVAKAEHNGDVWFFTARDTEKTREIENFSEVLVVFQNGHKCSVSLTGRAELISNRDIMADLWKEPYKVWFPLGVDDPSLQLIHVRAVEAEYWDSTGFKGIKYLFEAAKAYATGTTPHVDEPEQHGHVALK